MKKKDEKLIVLCEGAATIALAMVLGYVKIIELPQGGSITVGMLPIFIFCFRWGVKKGFIISFTYGILQMLLDGALAWSPWSIFLDYIFAYGVLGICGLFNKNFKTLIVGTWVAVFCRFIFHFISGVTLYKIMAPTELFNFTFTNPALYSAIYNGSYLLISLIACDIILVILFHTFFKQFRGRR